ncbi:MAG: alkylmercury lyase MerB, partial [Candidatus Dormibacteria bacterium]
SFEGWRALPQLLRLLARGQPVALAELTDLGGQSGAELERVLRAQPGTEWDDEGRLVGFGLTSQPTDYRFLIGGRTLYTWCATDTLFFTVILGEATVAESKCPVSGVPIRLEMTPQGIVSVTPPGTVVSQRHQQQLVGNLRSDVCDQGHFFASASAAAGWLAEHPEGSVLSVADAFEHCLSACEDLGWIAPGSKGDEPAPQRG